MKNKKQLYHKLCGPINDIELLHFISIEIVDEVEQFFEDSLGTQIEDRVRDGILSFIYSDGFREYQDR